MDLTEILEALGALDNAEELREGIASAIQSEKERGIEATRKKDRENLKLKNTLKDLGYDKDEFSNLDSFVEDTKKAKEASTKSKLTINSLNEKVDELVTNLNNEREARLAVEQKAKTKTLEAELTNAIGDKFYGAKYLIKDIITSGTVDIDDNGSVYFKDGDNVVSFDKGIENIMETNKEMLKVSQNGGTGDTGGETINTDILDGSADAVLDNLGL